MIYNFKEQLAFSQKLEDEGFWEKVYRELFPNYVNSMSLSGSTESQCRGKDRLVHLSNGTTLSFDEKKRERVYYQKDGRPCGEKEGELDFCLEYISDDERGTSGWIEKDLDIDYIAYAWMPIAKVELLPWWPLRKAWIDNKEVWIQRYLRTEAQNEGYKTIGVAVPRRIVWVAISHACQVVVPQYIQIAESTGTDSGGIE